MHPVQGCVFYTSRTKMELFSTDEEHGSCSGFPDLTDFLWNLLTVKHTYGLLFTVQAFAAPQ